MSKKSKIVLIDDDNFYLVLANQMVQNTFPEAVIKLYKSGVEALNYITNDPPDLLLLDINMPMMNGWDFLTEIHKKKSPAKFPVYMVTGSKEAYDHERAKQFSFVKGCILKPLDYNKLEKFAELLNNGQNQSFSM